jgi:hypothetical protein
VYFDIDLAERRLGIGPHGVEHSDGERLLEAGAYRHVGVEMDDEARQVSLQAALEVAGRDRGGGQEHGDTRVDGVDETLVGGGGGALAGNDDAVVDPSREPGSEGVGKV